MCGGADRADPLQGELREDAHGAAAAGPGGGDRSGGPGRAHPVPLREADEEAGVPAQVHAGAVERERPEGGGGRDPPDAEARQEDAEEGDERDSGVAAPRGPVRKHPLVAAAGGDLRGAAALHGRRGDRREVHRDDVAAGGAQRGDARVLHAPRRDFDHRGQHARVLRVGVAEHGVLQDAGVPVEVRGGGGLPGDHEHREAGDVLDPALQGRRERDVLRADRDEHGRERAVRAPVGAERGGADAAAPVRGVHQEGGDAARADGGAVRAGEERGVARGVRSRRLRARVHGGADGVDEQEQRCDSLQRAADRLLLLPDRAGARGAEDQHSPGPDHPRGGRQPGEGAGEGVRDADLPPGGGRVAAPGAGGA